MELLKLWIRATRPRTLWAAISPVIIGVAMVYEAGQVHWPAAIMTLFTAILIQIGTNFANDYYDFLKGADTIERQGPLRLTQAELVTPETMKFCFISVFILTFVCGM